MNLCTDFENQTLGIYLFKEKLTSLENSYIQ